MNLFFRLSISLATVLISGSTGFSGCASSALDMKAHDDKASKWAGTAILLDYHLLHLGNSAPDQNGDLGDCTLSFKNLGNDQDFTVQLFGHSHHVLADLPPGTYVGKTLSCRRLQTWELQSFMKGHFKITAGKINYLGKAIFNFTEDPSAQSAQSAMTVELPDAAELAQSIHADFERFPAAWISSLFNPFTQKSIDAAAIEPQKTHELKVHTHYQLSPGETSGPSTKGLEASLEECEIGEVHTYPYLLGHLLDTATYEGQKLIELKKNDHHSFSENFTSCLEQSFNDFTPADGTHLIVEVSF